MIRAKFVVSSIEHQTVQRWEPQTAEAPAHYHDVDAATISLYPVATGSDENRAFYASTPSGSLVLQTVNPFAWEQFRVGNEYYLDITNSEPGNVQPLEEIDVVECPGCHRLIEDDNGTLFCRFCGFQIFKYSADDGRSA